MHQFRFRLRWPLTVVCGILAALEAFGLSFADEPFPAPRPARPYDTAPPLNAAGPPVVSQLPNGKSIKLQVPPPRKPAKSGGAAGQPKDEPYVPQSIKDIAVDASELPSATDPESQMIRYAPEKLAELDPEHFSTRPVVLTRVDGRFIDQRLSGPVAPFCFLPTYFEDDSLTRFGYSHGDTFQPVLSASQFYLSVLMLPYQMQKRPPWEPVCPNYIPPPITLEGKAMKFYQGITFESVAAEAGAVAAVFLLFP